MKITVWAAMILVCMAAFSPSAALSAERTVELTIAKGDYLINVCKQYLDNPAKWRDIARINRLKNPDRIYPRQTLLVPVSYLRGVPVEGTITFIKGEVLVQNTGSSSLVPLALKDRVKEGSRIRTGDDSTAEVTFQDGSSLLQRSNTDLGIITAKQKGDAYFINKLSLQAGKVVTRIRSATGRESRFEVQTPSSTGVARGTEFRTSVDNEQASRFEVLEGNIDVEAQKKGIEVKAGEGTIVKKGESPLMPRKLLLPPAIVDLQAAYNSFPIVFRFAHVEGALAYRVLFTRDSSSRDIVKEQLVKPGEAMEIRDVPDATYYLQAASIDGDGFEGLVSQSSEVQVKRHPLPPFIRAPLDKSVVKGDTIEAMWLKVEDAAAYQLQVAHDIYFKDIIETRGNIKDVSHAVRLPAYKTYFFRIRSLGADGYEGAWSDTVSFTASEAPPLPQVQTPAIKGDEIYLRWTDVGKGYSYRVQMAAEREFTAILSDKKVGKPEIILQKPKEEGVYYVRTQVFDSTGYEGKFSPPQSFEVKARFPYEVLGGIIGGALLILLLAP